LEKLNTKKEIPGLNGLTLGDFWSWAYSDIMSNRNRSVFAEFLVAATLEVIDKPRVEWDAVDVCYRGRSIEVKASAYLQSWHQEHPSIIKFDIAKKRAWDPETNVIASEPVRSADCYVFCLYPETNSSKANILDVSSWKFYVLSTEQIEKEFGNQKSVGIKRLQAVCEPVQYEQLTPKIDSVLGLNDQKTN